MEKTSIPCLSVTQFILESVMRKNNTEAYKSAEGRRLLHDLYRKHLLALDVPLSEQMVETSFGDTHVMIEIGRASCRERV